MSRSSLSALTGVGLGALFLALEPSCLERHDDEPGAQAEARCASCHGDAQRAGDYLQRAAPPRDLLGVADPSYPGVGAHSIHVYASETHGAVACAECHVVPEATDSPGHADDRLPAELSFGGISKTAGGHPSYDFVARTCSDSWCHRDARAVWTEPRNSDDACGSCHGLPPPAPHPQSNRCETCHGEVIGADRTFVAPEKHVDGSVQLAPPGCSQCHGSGEDPAPPLDTFGNSEVSAIGVGAHQAHLAGGAFSRPLACGECHVVPTAVGDPGHADALPAEVVFSDVALSNGRTPSWDRATTSCSNGWCHAPSPVTVAASPSWVVPGPLECTSCHGTPPPPPHPQINQCSRCHGEVVAADNTTIVARERHVDGTVDVSFSEPCTACHGSVNPAPPVDLSGSSLTSSPGVGAHQTHLAGTPYTAPVACSACHVVPGETFASGHLDSPTPAEVIFSGAAVAYGSAPSYQGGTCQNTWCHGGAEPVWTIVDGTQAPCGSCHGLPPPPPHPKAEFNPVCSACHENIAPNNVTFVRPDLHVDGVVTFSLPP